MIKNKYGWSYLSQYEEEEEKKLSKTEDSIMFVVGFVLGIAATIAVMV